MSFEFQLVLTEKCDLDCKYCYMEKNPVSMTKETFDKHYKMLPRLMSYYQKNEYVAALFGGEPLLNWELIEYITPILNADPRCKHIIAMTNGLALKDKYKRNYIEQNRISLSLSFDGLWNEKGRPLKNGKSSLDQYLNDPLLSYFQGKGGCKVMVSPDSVPTLVENFKWFVDKFKMPCPDFSLVRDDIWKEEDIEIFEKEAKKLTDTMIEYFNNGQAVMVGFFQLYILDLLFGESYGKRPFGCFAGCNGAGFMPNGKVYPCARFGSKKIKAIANSNNGILLNDLKKMNDPFITNPRFYEKCKGCSLYKYCNAGCTYQQMKNGSVYKSEPIDSICKLLHICYEQSIRIMNELKDNDLFIQMIKNSIKNVG